MAERSSVRVLFLTIGITETNKVFKGTVKVQRD